MWLFFLVKNIIFALTLLFDSLEDSVSNIHKIDILTFRYKFILKIHALFSFLKCFFINLNGIKNIAIKNLVRIAENMCKKYKFLAMLF